MKIGVVSDTHSLALPRQLTEGLKKVDLIIHAGDFCSLKDVEAFKKLKELKAVFGNMDDDQVRKKFPEKQIINCEGVKIGVTHGRGAPNQVMDSAKETFKDDAVDVIIFGHSHQPLNKKVGDVLFFNPGSPNDQVNAPYFSFGIIDINKGNIKADIIKIKTHG